MKYVIRYNVDHRHGLSDKRWKIYAYDGSEFHLVDHISIKAPSWTADTINKDGHLTYSIITEGTLTINSDKAEVTP